MQRYHPSGPLWMVTFEPLWENRVRMAFCSKRAHSGNVKKGAAEDPHREQGGQIILFVEPCMVNPNSPAGGKMLFGFERVREKQQKLHPPENAKGGPTHPGKGDQGGGG